MTDNSSKTFFYSEADGRAKTRSIKIPSVGYLEAIDEHILELRKNKVEFNAARVFSGEIIAHCIQCIEKEHTNPLSKASKLLELFSKIEGADGRFRLENLKTAIDFLLENVKLIGEGIASNTTVTPQNPDQLEVREKLLDTLTYLTCARLENGKSATDLLDAYSRYFEPFFQAKHLKNDFSPSQLDSAKKMLRIYSTLKIETPDYMKDIRVKVLNGFSKDAFNIVSKPDSNAGIKIHGLISQLVNQYFKIALKPDDPIACVQDGKETLLRARDSGGKLAFIFNSEYFSISARTESSLNNRASGVHTMHGKSPAETVETLLQMMPD